MKRIVLERPSTVTVSELNEAPGLYFSCVPEADTKKRVLQLMRRPNAWVWVCLNDGCEWTPFYSSLELAVAGRTPYATYQFDSFAEALEWTKEALG